MTAPATAHDARCGTWLPGLSCNCRDDAGYTRDEPAIRCCSADCPEPAAYQVGPESLACRLHLSRVLDAYLATRRGCAPVAPITSGGSQ